MKQVFKLPDMGLNSDNISLIQWYVEEGDIITKGDLIADIETDKVSLEVEIDDKILVKKILVQAGPESFVSPGTPILEIATNDDISSLDISRFREKTKSSLKYKSKNILLKFFEFLKQE